MGNQPRHKKNLGVLDWGCGGLLFLMFCGLVDNLTNSRSPYPTSTILFAFIFLLVVTIVFGYQRGWLLNLPFVGTGQFNGLGKPLKWFDYLLIIWFMVWLVLLPVQLSRTPNDASGRLTIVAFLIVSAIWFAARRGLVTASEPAPPPPPPSPDPSTLPPPAIFQITLGRLEDWDPIKSKNLIEAILRRSQSTTVSFVIEATTISTKFLIEFSTGYVDLATLQALANASYPGAHVQEAFKPNYAFPFHRKLMIFRRSDKYDYYESLSLVETNRKTDPLVTLTQALDILEPDEVVQYKVTHWDTKHFNEKEIDYLLTQTMAEAGQDLPRYYPPSKKWTDIIGENIADGIIRSIRRVPRYSASEERRHRAKLSQPLYYVTISIFLDTPKPERLSWFEALTTAVKNFSHPDHPLIEEGHTQEGIIKDVDRLVDTLPDVIVEQWFQSDSPTVHEKASEHFYFITIDELAALWHLPHKGFTAEAVQAGSNQTELPRELRSVTQGIQIGVNRFAGREYPVRLPHDNRVIPTTIIGKPGTGKSSLMHHMIHDDIASGKGLCLIDPKGTLVSRVLQHSIPKHREKDVIVLDVITKVEGIWYPPPLNILGSSIEVSEDIAASKLMNIMDKLFDNFSDTRMADTLNMALMAIASRPGTTILDVYHFLADPYFRANFSSTISDPIVKSYWESFDSYSERQPKNLTDPILWRLRSFVNNRYLRAMTCQSEPFDLPQMVAENKIILVSLAASENVIPERERYVLGAFLISQIDMVARDRVIRDAPFMLYIDETQEFVRTALPSMLSQLREYRLGLVLANQYYRQLFGETFDALEGTASTIIGFEVGRPDATMLASYMRPEFTADDFMTLGQYRAGVSMVFNNRRQRPFTLETLPPPGFEQGNPEREAYLRKLSVENLKLKPYSVVIDECHSKYGHHPQSLTTNPSDGQDDEFFEKPKQ